jgi:hypothetical protein
MRVSLPASDPYRFVEQGIPAVFVTTGLCQWRQGGDGFFMRTNYHKPSDDLSQPDPL